MPPASRSVIGARPTISGKTGASANAGARTWLRKPAPGSTPRGTRRSGARSIGREADGGGARQTANACVGQDMTKPSISARTGLAPSCAMRRRALKAITASEAKSGFDDFIEAVQSEPVVVTQENRPIGVMLSMRDVETLFGGDADAIVATLKEKRLDIQLAQSR